MGGWESPEMVRRYADLAADHLAPYAERLGSLRTKDVQNMARLGPRPENEELRQWGQVRVGIRTIAVYVLPALPLRQWVLSVPKRLRYFLARDTALKGVALRGRWRNGHTMVASHTMMAVMGGMRAFAR